MNFRTGAASSGSSGAVRLHEGAGDADVGAEDGGGEPGDEEAPASLLPAGDDAGDDAEDADGDLPPSGDGGEAGGRGHGLADELEVLAGAVVESGGGAGMGGGWGAEGSIVKYFV